MKVSTNPMHQVNNSFEGLALTELKINSLEGLIVESVKAFLVLEGKSDYRGYSKEIAITTFKKAHFRTTMLGKFFHLDSLLELLNEMELEKSANTLKLVMSHLQINKDNKLSSRITNGLAPIIIPTVTAELLYSIVDSDEVVINIDKILHARMRLINPDELNNPSEKVTIGDYVTDVLTRALEHSEGVSNEEKSIIHNKYNTHCERVCKKLLSAN